MLSGLLKGSFVPLKEIRELRDLPRFKRKLEEQISSEKNRIQKILEDGNIKISSVVSNMSGAVAAKIVDDLTAGEEDISKPVSHRHGRMRTSESDLAKSLDGNLTTHHPQMLGLIKQSVKDKELLISNLNKIIDEHLKASELELDRDLLSTVPGVGKEGVVCILAETGNDMDVFPTKSIWHLGQG